MVTKLKKFLREGSHSNDKHLYRGRTCRFKAYIAILAYLMLIKGLFIVVSIFVYNVYMRVGAIYINIEYEGGIICVQPKCIRLIHIKEKLLMHALLLQGHVMIGGTVGAYYPYGKLYYAHKSRCCTDRRVVYHQPQDRNFASWYDALSHIVETLLKPWGIPGSVLDRVSEEKAFQLIYHHEKSPIEWSPQAKMAIHPAMTTNWSIKDMKKTITYARRQGWTTPIFPNSWLWQTQKHHLKMAEVVGVDYPTWLKDLEVEPSRLSPALAALMPHIVEKSQKE